MNDAELYHENNSLQKRDAILCLQEYSDKFKWRGNDRVIDLGCGDGGVTTTVLKKFMPTDFQRLVGCDISARMVEFANEHHRDERTSFSVLDLQGEVPGHMREAFDHAFSFYTMHWILDQERAFTNIYQLLSRGGDCFLIFLGHMPMFDVFRMLAARPKWRWWLRDVDRYVSPYHEIQEPEKEVRKTMAKIGFKNITVECKTMKFVFDKLDVYKRAILAVNPFKMPTGLQEEFFEDYLQIVRDMKLVEYELNNNVGDGEHISINTHYCLLIAYGTKGRRTTRARSSGCVVREPLRGTLCIVALVG